METEVEIKKVEVEPQRSIPAVALTALAMSVALIAIILGQKYFNPPAPHAEPVPQTQTE